MPMPHIYNFPVKSSYSASKVWELKEEVQGDQVQNLEPLGTYSSNTLCYSCTMAVRGLRYT